VIGARQDSSDAIETAASAAQRLVIVAENSLLVEAIRIGFRRSVEFHVVGHAAPSRTSARTILSAAPQVILLDDMGRSHTAVELLRTIRSEDERVALIVLTMQPDAWWLEQLFAAGANCTISKATDPAALATLVRESFAGHIFHHHPDARRDGGAARPDPTARDLPLTQRELEILTLVASGATNGDIARRLWVTEGTVKFHLRNIYRKLDVANRTQASQIAFANGLVASGPTVIPVAARDPAVPSSPTVAAVAMQPSPSPV
jgi:DNA-binding NarL/FixJ family response regulator